MPLAVVVDADFLSRSVDHALVHGYEPSVVRRASGHYTSFTGIVVFATERVFEETIDRFDAIAAHRTVDVDQVYRVWDSVFASNIRVVRMNGVDLSDPRVDDVARRDPDDTPTAVLAVLLAPCFLLTDNREHFQAFGVPTQHPSRVHIDVTTAFSLDIRDLGEFLEGLNAGTLPIRLGGVAALEGGKALVRWIGRDAALALVLLLLGGAALYWRTPGGQQFRTAVTEGLKRVADEYGEDIAKAFEAGKKVGDRLAAYAVLPGEESALSLVSRRLVGEPSLTTAEISDGLSISGYRYRPAKTHRARVREWLSSRPCFWESPRGHWLLGYHPMPFLNEKEPKNAH